MESRAARPPGGLRAACCHGPRGRGQDGGGGQRQRVRPGGRRGAGPVHLHYEEEDGQEDEDHRDACMQALRLWTLLATYAVAVGQNQGQKNQECPKLNAQDGDFHTCVNSILFIRQDARISEEDCPH